MTKKLTTKNTTLTPKIKLSLQGKNTEEKVESLSPKSENAVTEARARADAIKAERKRRGINYGERTTRFPKFEKNENYFYRWVNSPNVPARKSQGYELAPEYETDVLVDKGDGTRAILMRIPVMIHEEDKRHEQELISQSEKELFRGINPTDRSVESNALYGSTKIDHVNPKQSIRTNIA